MHHPQPSPAERHRGVTVGPGKKAACAFVPRFRTRALRRASHLNFNVNSYFRPWKEGADQCRAFLLRYPRNIAFRRYRTCLLRRQ